MCVKPVGEGQSTLSQVCPDAGLTLVRANQCSGAAEGAAVQGRGRTVCPAFKRLAAGGWAHTPVIPALAWQSWRPRVFAAFSGAPSGW